MLVILFFLLIKDSIERPQKDKKRIDEWRQKLLAKSLSSDWESDEESPTESEIPSASESIDQKKYTSAIKIAEEIGSKLKEKIDKDFRDMILCLLKKFIYEELLKIYMIRYEEEFKTKYSTRFTDLINLINSEWIRTSSERRAKMCDLCYQSMKPLWIDLTVYGSCMEDPLLVPCRKYSYDVSKWYTDVQFLEPLLNKFISENVNSEIIPFLLNKWEIDTHARLNLKYLRDVRLLLFELNHPKSDFMSIFPDDLERTYIIFNGLSMLPIFADFHGPITHQMIFDYNEKHGGDVQSLMLICEYVYNSSPGHQPKIHSFILRKLLIKFIDYKIMYFGRMNQISMDDVQKWIRSKSRKFPPQHLPTVEDI